MQSIRTVTYDRIPITLVHPKWEEDLTVMYLLLPTLVSERREVLLQSLPWLKRLRRWFTDADTIVMALDAFLRELTWKDLNHVQVDAERFWDWREVKMTSAEASDYDLRVMTSLFARNLSDESFSTQLCLELMR
jgi:hypothetical protein